MTEHTEGPYLEDEVIAQIQQRVLDSVVVVTFAANGKIDLTRLSSVSVPLVIEWLRALADDMAGEEQAVLDRSDSDSATEQEQLRSPDVLD